MPDDQVNLGLAVAHSTEDVNHLQDARRTRLSTVPAEQRSLARVSGEVRRLSSAGLHGSCLCGLMTL
jgi:hypothetical protein